MRTRTGISILVVFLLATFAAARSDRGQVRGRVTGASGAVVPGVTVTLIPSAGPGRQAAVTNDRGEYMFANVAPGAYRLEFALAGFRTILQPVDVRSGRTERVDARLVVGGLSDSISVQAASPTVATRSSAQAKMVGSGIGAGSGIGVGGGYHLPGRYAGPFHTEAYDSLEENPFRRVASDALSTFSIDVDTASYANVRRFLTAGALPPAGAVRIEELVNYFRFAYPPPAGDAPFSITTELAACPWNSRHHLALVGLQGRELGERDDTARNLVFLIDVSGSMATPDKLPLVRTAMRMLADTLTPRDRVAIVVYAGASGLVLPSTPGDHKSAIHRAIAELESGGSTNGAAGITLAYRVAREHFVRGGINRVVLATDGDFNVGVTSQDELVRLIEEERASGIFLSVLGVGTGNLKDSTMEKLADKGNGNYSYLDSLHEARKVLVREAGGTLVTIAKDVKMSVDVPPSGSVSLDGFVFQACSIDHSDISPFKINDLRAI